MREEADARGRRTAWPSVLFEVGEQVRVADRPFAGFNGTVQEIDEEKGLVKAYLESSDASSTP